MRTDQRYHEVVSQAEADPHVLGLVLGGGRGKGVFSEASDYDIAIVVTNNAPEDIAKGYRSLYEAEVIDIHVLTLDEFRLTGDWRSTSAWAAYGLSHLTAQIDKTGEIQTILDRREPYRQMKCTILLSVHSTRSSTNTIVPSRTTGMGTQSQPSWMQSSAFHYS